MDPEFLTLREAAKFLKISTATLNRFIRDENVPTFKIGGRRLFEKGELTEWVKSHRSGEK